MSNLLATALLAASGFGVKPRASVPEFQGVNLNPPPQPAERPEWFKAEKKARRQKKRSRINKRGY